MNESVAAEAELHRQTRRLRTLSAQPLMCPENIIAAAIDVAIAYRQWQEAYFRTYRYEVPARCECGCLTRHPM